VEQTTPGKYLILMEKEVEHSLAEEHDIRHVPISPSASRSEEENGGLRDDPVSPGQRVTTILSKPSERGAGEWRIP
jgi:hypothetical protein